MARWRRRRGAYLSEQGIQDESEQFADDLMAVGFMGEFDIWSPPMRLRRAGVRRRVFRGRGPVFDGIAVAVGASPLSAPVGAGVANRQLVFPATSFVKLHLSES